MNGIGSLNNAYIHVGTIKDTVTRYAHQTGHYVSRRFGWDCHGLPVEYEIDKAFNITSRYFSFSNCWSLTRYIKLY
jgi:isoleucyl-tRNA synthetase